MRDEKFDALWELCKAVYGEKAKFQDYITKQEELFKKATEIINNSKQH